jgi:F-type H+-transporting ATPase subunit b
MSSIMQEAEFWVAIGMAILFVALIWAKVPGLAFKALDDRGAKIQAALDEALALRQEAQQVLARIKAEREAAEHVAAEMIKNAEDDSARIRKDAEAKLAEQIERRHQMAERKIAAAEAQAAADVKAAAADLAAHLAETVLTARLQAMKTDPLIDQAVANMAGKLQ